MNNLSFLLKNTLKSELKLLKKYGVDHLGYRYFLPDGRSFGCPTIELWYEKSRHEGFYDEMKRYLSEELMSLSDKGFLYVTRSRDHIQDSYLDSLSAFNLDSSLGIYKFGANRIDSFFFICDSKNAEARDTLLNNIKYLEGHANSLSKKIDALNQSINDFKNVEFYIDKNLCNRLFKQGQMYLKNYQKCLNITINGKEITLTHREIETLGSLRFAATNKAIAYQLGITEKTVEKHIQTLKEKLYINGRQDLVKVANIPQLITVYKKGHYG